MGVHQNVGIDKFPRQGRDLGKRVKVFFHYDATVTVPGTVVRDDYEDPWLAIIALDDGRYVLTTECQYSLED